MTFEELRDKLNQPTDPQLIRRRWQDGTELDYLEWHVVNRILDSHCPGWSGEATVTVAGDTVIVTYTISIPTEEGLVRRAAVGSEKLGTGFDPIASAEQKAFKRAAARFGIGLDLYEKGTASTPQESHTFRPQGSHTFSKRPPGWVPATGK